jgi:hypothetical protein
MRLFPALLPIALLCLACGPSKPPASEEKRPKAAADPPKIAMFYASPEAIAKGQQANICYGTSDVTAVRVEPPVEKLRPALSHCFAVSPKETTTYKLIAQGPGGETSKSLTLKVGAAAVAKPAAKASETALILFFLTSTPELPKGLPATLCYGVKDATSVRLEPEGPALKPSERYCFTMQPQQTTKYTLVANGPSGTDRQDLTVTVK